MNNGKALSKKQLSILLLILLVLGLLSAAVLASRLGNQKNQKKDDGNTIPIGDDAERVSEDGEEDPDKPLEAELKVIHDDNLFRVSYSNDTGKVTVLSSEGDKVIAPGTIRYYNFSLLNTKDVSLDYELHVTVTIEGTDYVIPVVARLKGPDKWVSGKGAAFVPVLDLNDLRERGVLAGGNRADYRFTWKWPFKEGEEADEFDTMLGNLAMEGDLILRIRISIYAWTDEIPDKPGGYDPSPGTGESFNVTFWVTLMVLSLFAFVAVLARDKRRQTPVQEALGYAEANQDKRE